MESRVDAVNPGETEGSSEQDAAVGLTSGKKAEEKPHFVIQHRTVLIQKVSAVMPIVDRLYSLKMVNSEHYATIKAEKTTMAQMRELYGKIDVAGPRIRAAFYSALEQHEPHLLVSLGAVLPSEDSANSEVLTPQRLKSYLKKEGQHLIEWKRPEENPEETPLNQDFTEVNVTVVGRGEVNKEHEVSQIETMSRKTSRPETPIKSLDISKPLPGEGKIRTVLMKGVAGSGKTALTQKYIQDWAEDKANQDILFLFPFAFRELNVKQKEKKCSLMELLRDSFGEINKTDICSGKGSDVMFIFDGLDEFSTPLLDLFQKKEICTDVEKIISVEMLLTNLIKGNLLPNARIWITTRPAAATQIPAKYVDRVTEVRGFTDDQKEEYFKKRISDETMANKIISHIKTSRILHIMCHIPVFCWIIAYVLKDILITGTGMLPKTMTEMFIHFMLVQSKQKEIKYDWSPEKNTNAILSMGKLAYKHLEKGNLIFSEADLKECGIDINDAAVCSGVFAQTFKEVRGGLHKDKVFSFVHLSVQEFLAALYVFHTFTNTGVNVLSPSKWSKLFRPQLNDLYKSAVDMALKSPNGHLDLFLRFLLGLSSKTNQTLLQRLLEHTGNSSQANQKTVQYIKKKIRKNLSPERTINLFHCLNELGDHSLEEEIQQYLTSGSLSTVSPAQWSALAFVLLSSGKELDVFDLKKYGGSEEALLRLLPVVKASNRALLSGCNLTERCCVELASTLSSNCSLKELDISNNDLQDLGIKHLCSGLRSPDCKLETLRLSGCNLTERCCVELASTLSSNCSLKELDISNNDLQDLGIKHLCSGLRSPDCKLETLRLSGCMVSKEGCSHLVSALRSNSHLKVLDLSYNHPGDQETLPSAGQLQTLSDHSGECRLRPGVRKYVCELTLNPNTAYRELSLSENYRKVTWVREDQHYPDHPDRFTVWDQVLCTETLTGRCYSEMECSGHVRIGVTNREIKRKGSGYDCLLGNNNISWCLRCYNDNSYSVIHNGKETKLSVRPSDSVRGLRRSYRVAVYVDCPAGTLSFYKVSSNTLTHLHTFQISSTGPLCVGFMCYPGSGGSVSLCQI